jgi:hypothetical protein
VKCREFNLLYRGSNLWVNAINVAIVLKGSHHFVYDPEYGEILMRMLLGTFKEEDCMKINQCVIGVTLRLPVEEDVPRNPKSTSMSISNELINDDQEYTTSTVQLPSLSRDDNIAYACHTNAEKTAIHASIFQKHITEFPAVGSEELPPSHTHTLVVKADIMRAPKRKPKSVKTSHQDAFRTGPIKIRTPSSLRLKGACRPNGRSCIANHKKQNEKP